MLYLPKPLKTALLLSLLLTCTFCLHAQNKKPETIFTTINEDQEPEGEKHYFGQFSLSIPIRSNPYRDEYNTYTDTNGNGITDESEREYTVLDYIWPDGVSLHYGAGVHYKKWIAISANTGIDWLVTGKLVSVPVYASLYFSRQIWESTNVVLQGGYGYTFALGRGNLGGAYQKYRIGLGFDNESIFYIEANMYGFNLYDMKPAGSLCLGISIIDFF